MSTLRQIRSQGFTLRAVENRLYIEPIDELTESQRIWLINHRARILEQLLAERWHWFISLASEHGIFPDVVAEEFPSWLDKLDVIEPTASDDFLRRCMGTLCQDTRVKQRQRDYEEGCMSW